MDTAECVRVAVNIRPLITSELLLGCTDCISVVPGEPQVLYYFSVLCLMFGIVVYFAMLKFRLFCIVKRMKLMLVCW